jgi:hypothetical protein
MKVYRVDRKMNTWRVDEFDINLANRDNFIAYRVFEIGSDFRVYVISGCSNNALKLGKSLIEKYLKEEYLMPKIQSDIDVFKNNIDAVLKESNNELREIMYYINDIDIEEAMIKYLEKRRYTVLTDADVHGF